MNARESQALVDMAEAVKTHLLPALGDDVTREGLRDTPRRFASMMLEMTEGLRSEPPTITTFERGENDQMVTVLDIDYWSLCEHHLVPFYGKAHIGYLPGEKIAGLSKFGRVVDWFARRPQTQEYMTSQIAQHLTRVLEPMGLIVMVEGRHLCMSMRGVKKPNHNTVTSAIRGNIPRAEFFDIMKSRHG